MNVSDMIGIMRTLGIGQVYSDNESKTIFLSFLNLAHNQLYRETANLNDDILVKETLTNDPIQGYITLSQNPFSISRIRLVGTTCILDGLSVLDLDSYEARNVNSGNPSVYSNSKKIVNFYPFVNGNSYQFSTFYPPRITALDETTLEEDIPYPIEYHDVVVNGALYYLFQDESGFKNPKKEGEALSRWDEGRVDLKSYLFGKSRLSINTFENA